MTKTTATQLDPDGLESAERRLGPDSTAEEEVQRGRCRSCGHFFCDGSEALRLVCAIRAFWQDSSVSAATAMALAAAVEALEDEAADDALYRAEQRAGDGL